MHCCYRETRPRKDWKRGRERRRQNRKQFMQPRRVHQVYPCSRPGRHGFNEAATSHLLITIADTALAMALSTHGGFLKGAVRGRRTIKVYELCFSAQFSASLGKLGRRRLQCRRLLFIIVPTLGKVLIPTYPAVDTLALSYNNLAEKVPVSLTAQRSRGVESPVCGGANGVCQ